MKIVKSIISCLLVGVILLGILPATSLAASIFPSETDPFVSNYYIGKTNQDLPFFDSVLPEIEKNIKKNNTHSISKYYDKMPVANNPENFQGLGSTTYANINGKTVTAEAFYRLTNESLCDPNNGMGLLIYQCIQYKRKHPDEDVKITFSSYRTSVTAAVCVIPTSKYYGYMRSLYGTNYDEHGFVRISYMLTEAARMGIEVTMVNQLNSYGVKQYNPSTKSLKTRSNLDHYTYFSKALETDCYDAYAPGKKVSDFFDYTKVGWTIDDKTSDMQHVKSATVSHYLATDGSEHKDAIFFSSANLDENNYIGANGNNCAQSGVIISDHSELYRVTYNYMRLMYDYRRQEGMFELRKYVNQANEEQIALINSGRESEIPKDKQIVYLGGKNDPVFELYFTPFGGAGDAWDAVANPICKYAEKLPESKDYVEVIWNEYGYGNCLVGERLSDMFEQAFCNNPNPKNKISMRVTGFDTEAIEKLGLGSEIGYRSIKSGANVHAKDFLFSYEENGKRHRVSLMTSCNFYMIAFNYRTNSLLVINETDESGGNFYNIFGEKYSYGMIDNDLMVDTHNLALEPGDSYKVTATYSGKNNLTWKTSDSSVATVSKGKITAVKEGNATITVINGKHKATVKVTVTDCLPCYNGGKGLTFSTDEQYTLSRKYDSMPVTFESAFSVEQKDLTGTTTLIGSDGTFDPALVFSLNKSGNPRIAIRNKADYSKQSVYVFKNVNVATGEKVHLSLVIDRSNKKALCYVNGKLEQTLKLSSFTPFEEKHKAVIGGDHRNGNATYFKGTMYDLSVWSDVRSAKEIKKDFTNGIDYTDAKLLAAYDFNLCKECMMQDLSTTGNNLEHMVFWQSEKDVAPIGDYEYSFAVIGDTQTMNEKDPDAMEAIYDWLIANKEDQKIEYVIGLGDITDDSTDTEWENANNYISKLNGVIPYALTRGNHDDWDDFNRNLHNGYYETTVNGMMNEGTVSLTDINQPGLIKKTLEDGTVIYVTREEDIPEGGDVQGDLTNSYRYFNIQGTDYLIMTLDFAPNEKTLEWANKVIKAHPNHKVIAVTHAYMYRDGTTIDDDDCYPPTYYSGYTNAQNGDDMWKKCFSKHDNVLMVLSGHDPWQHIVYRQDKGENGNIVTQMLIDAQYVDLNNGSTGMVAMFYFSNDGKTLTVRYYSVEKGCYGSPLSQFTIDLTKHTHTYEESTITPATFSKNGKLESVCTTCGKTKSTTIYSPKTVKLSTTEYTDTGAVRTPSVTVKTTKGKTLKKGIDYVVKYEDGRNAPGKYTVKVIFKGKYEGSKSLTFTITPERVSKLTATQTTKSITLKWSKVSGASGYRVYQYNSKTKEYKHIASVTKGTSYKVSNLKPGTKYKFKVRAYTKDDGTIWGSYSKTFETATKCSKPKITSLSSTTKGKANITWSDVTGESGYQVYYSTKKDGSYKKVSSYKTDILTASKSKLTSKKNYYFKVRAYKKTDSGTVYSSWSDVKSVKIK